MEKILIDISKSILTGVIIFLIMVIADRNKFAQQLYKKYDNLFIICLVLLIGLVAQLIIG
ncbi:MAG: hypothetical protein ACRCX8_16665 [Sarcina sp.]